MVPTYKPGHTVTATGFRTAGSLAIAHCGLQTNKITDMYSGPSSFSALDFPELTAFTNVAGPGSCLVYNGSGHLALQPQHGSDPAAVWSSAAGNPAKETTKLWRYLAGQPITKADILEYIKLAELALVMTPGSVQEERMFSAMAYLKDDTRNRLQECHLNVCARVFSSNQFDLDTFPDERAISKWLDNAAVRGRYRL
ncbi:hypothetical protein QJQ45_009964 [Haematococcus lacustris]|nr:hypothetical protein QJQ45_009964 [Haematococcus lacustris]